MKFKLITSDGPEYHAERMLRWEVLAKPLGIPPDLEAAPEEDIACISLQSMANASWDVSVFILRPRQMAAFMKWQSAKNIKARASAVNSYML